MTKDKATSLISARVGETVEVLTLDVMPWVMTDHTAGMTWRQHLTVVFARRLKGALAKGSSGYPVEEMKRLLSALDRQTKEQPLTCFSARSKRVFHQGWLIGDEVAYCISSESESDADGSGDVSSVSAL